jgi:hypothetical protein
MFAHGPFWVVEFPLCHFGKRLLIDRCQSSCFASRGLTRHTPLVVHWVVKADLPRRLPRGFITSEMCSLPTDHFFWVYPTLKTRGLAAHMVRSVRILWMQEKEEIYFFLFLP